MALPDATIPQVVKALTAALHFFGGAPLSLKTDNMKQVVTKSCRYEPLFTEALQQWAQHYNITLLATRVAKPQDKGAVENEVKIAYQRIYAPLRDTVFYYIDELNIAIREQLTLHNEKLFQLKNHSRLELFEKKEKCLLNVLPMQPGYEVADVVRRAGTIDGFTVHQQKTLRAIKRCRTAALGGHIDACNECGNISISYNSCRNRHCFGNTKRKK